MAVLEEGTRHCEVEEVEEEDDSVDVNLECNPIMQSPYYCRPFVVAHLVLLLQE
jgi:hypothetical protein